VVAPVQLLAETQLDRVEMRVQAITQGHAERLVDQIVLYLAGFGKFAGAIVSRGDQVGDRAASCALSARMRCSAAARSCVRE
jgi:hypothetical protein